MILVSQNINCFPPLINSKI